MVAPQFAATNNGSLTKAVEGLETSQRLLLPKVVPERLWRIVEGCSVVEIFPRLSQHCGSLSNAVEGCRRVLAVEGCGRPLKAAEGRQRLSKAVEGSCSSLEALLKGVDLKGCPSAARALLRSC